MIVVNIPVQSQDPIRDLLVELIGKLFEQLSEEITEQGHTLTGNLLTDAKQKVLPTTDGHTGTLDFPYYWKYLEDGVPAEKIKFEYSRSGYISPYIEGLINFFTLRGVPDPKSAAFATANVHKQTGIPTPNAYNFSKNGRRTGFVSHTMTGADIEASVDKAINDWFSNRADLILDGRN